VLGVEHHHFEDILDHHKTAKCYMLDTDLSADDWVELVARYRARLQEEHGAPFRRTRTNSYGVPSALCSAPG